MAKLTIPLDKLNPFAKTDKPQDRPKPFSSKDKPPIFDTLFQCSWRGVSFPVESISINIQQDLADHCYWGRDGANIESTGRAPLEIEAVIPFVNGIVPGKNERWGILYPTQYLLFLEAMNDRTSGVLDTPEFSGLTCKPVSASFAYDAQRRDGVQVTAKWIETIDLDLNADVVIAPFGVAQLAALSLDADLPRAPIPDPPVFQETFESLMSKVSGVVDTTASRTSLLLNKPAQIMYRVNKVKESVQRGKNVTTWPIEEACEKIEAAMADLSTTTATNKNPAPLVSRQPARLVGRYTTTTRMSLSMIQGLFPNNKIDDIISLNPRLVAHPVVPPDTVIRYYK